MPFQEDSGVDAGFAVEDYQNLSQDSRMDQKIVAEILKIHTNTEPGSFSPLSFDTSAFSLIKPMRSPLKKSTDWISMVLSMY